MYSYSYQGYLLYRDANSHSMTAIRINPETLEQDGTVALPGMNTRYEKMVIVYCLHAMYFQVSRREIERDF